MVKGIGWNEGHSGVAALTIIRSLVRICDVHGIWTMQLVYNHRARQRHGLIVLMTGQASCRCLSVVKLYEIPIDKACAMAAFA
jgi:hypothetical protein